MFYWLFFFPQTASGDGMPFAEAWPEFAALRCHYGTGRVENTGFILNDKGKLKPQATRYRHGIMTNLGDIEQGDWKCRVYDLIARNRDETTFQRLLTMTPFRAGTEDCEIRALELYVSRIWENPTWVGYEEWHHPKQERTEEK